MFLIQYPKDYLPFNTLFNFDKIKRIEYTNLKYFSGYENEKEEEESYEIRIIYDDSSEEFYVVSEENEIKHFFDQLRKMGLKD